MHLVEVIANQMNVIRRKAKKVGEPEVKCCQLTVLSIFIFVIFTVFFRLFFFNVAHEMEPRFQPIFLKKGKTSWTIKKSPLGFFGRLPESSACRRTLLPGQGPYGNGDDGAACRGPFLFSFFSNAVLEGRLRCVLNFFLVEKRSTFLIFILFVSTFQPPRNP